MGAVGEAWKAEEPCGACEQPLTFEPVVCITRRASCRPALLSLLAPRCCPSLQAKWSSIDFDYLAYAQLRWGEYRRRKDEFLAQAQAAFASPSAADRLS